MSLVLHFFNGRPLWTLLVLLFPLIVSLTTLNSFLLSLPFVCLCVYLY